jgi:hypothetical protein
VERRRHVTGHPGAIPTISSNHNDVIDLTIRLRSMRAAAEASAQIPAILRAPGAVHDRVRRLRPGYPCNPRLEEVCDWMHQTAFDAAALSDE